MVEWVNTELKPYLEQHSGGKGSGKVSLLMMDNYKAHLTKETRFAISECGCVLKLQILDVGVNKPFKNYYEHQKDMPAVQHEHDRKVSRKLCVEWTCEAWEDLKKSTIINTAQIIGFLGEE